MSLRCVLEQDINPSLVLAQPRKTHSNISEKLLYGTLRIKSNKQTKCQKNISCVKVVGILLGIGNALVNIVFFKRMYYICQTLVPLNPDIPCFKTTDIKLFHAQLN